MTTIQASSGDKWIVTVNAGATTEHRVRVTQAEEDRNCEKYSVLQSYFGME